MSTVDSIVVSEVSDVDVDACAAASMGVGSIPLVGVDSNRT